MSKQNVPELRMDGFEGEWDQVRLSTITREVKRIDPGSSAPVMMITARDGFVEQSSRYGFDNAGKSRQKYIELREGELAYNHGASKLRRFGSCFALQEPVALVPFVYHCFTVPNDDPTFMEYQLNDKSMEVQLGRLVSSGARMDGLLNISFQEYGTVLVKRPSLPEQQATGNLFRRIDTTIASHKKKLDLLKQTKTSLLQRMFPQDGATVPELRLDGFSGGWQTTKIGGITTSFSGGTPTAGNQSYYGGPIPFIRSAEINSSQTELTLTHAGLELSSAKLVHKGTVLFALYGATAGVIGRARITGAINQAILALIPVDGVDPDFLIAWFEKMKPYLLEKYLQGGQGNLSGRLVKNFEITMPRTLDEQRVIGAVFSKLDSLISAEAQYIDKLTQTKTALLQKMFV